MQCPSCQFENMPGAVTCGRCRAALQLSGTTVDVHPPRAGRYAKQLRRWLPVRHLRFSAGQRLTDFARRLTPRYAWDRPATGVWLRLALPGWPQRYLGQRKRGQVFWWLYVILLLVALISLGTTAGALAVGLALSLHISSICDICWSADRDWRVGLSTSAAMIAVVGVSLYLPAVWTMSRFVGVRRINLTAGPLREGDAVVYHRGTAHVGDVVVYRIREHQLAARGNVGENIAYFVRGEYIDRIVAGPGQLVLWEDRHLLVDGHPSAWQPLNPGGIPADLKFVVPEGYYGILPSTQPQVAPVFPSQVWQAVSIVPRQSIEGVVVLRHRPPWRWGGL